MRGFGRNLAPFTLAYQDAVHAGNAEEPRHDWQTPDAGAMARCRLSWALEYHSALVEYDQQDKEVCDAVSGCLQTAASAPLATRKAAPKVGRNCEVGVVNAQTICVPGLCSMFHMAAQPGYLAQVRL